MGRMWPNVFLRFLLPWQRESMFFAGSRMQNDCKINIFILFAWLLTYLQERPPATIDIFCHNFPQPGCSFPSGSFVVHPLVSFVVFELLKFVQARKRHRFCALMTNFFFVLPYCSSFHNFIEAEIFIFCCAIEHLSRFMPPPLRSSFKHASFFSLPKKHSDWVIFQSIQLSAFGSILHLGGNEETTPKADNLNFLLHQQR